MNGYSEADLTWRMHDSAAAAIDRADTKAGFAATLETALTAVVFTQLSQSHATPLVGRVLFGLSLAALAVAFCSAVLVVTPRLHQPSKELEPGEFLFFGAVRLRSIEQLRTHMVGRGYYRDQFAVAEPHEAVAHQAKRLAEIAWTKHRWTRVSFLALLVGAVLALGGALLGGAR